MASTKRHEKHNLRWLKLDNAAKIYPAARRRNWSNVFRLSATLSDPVDRDVLRSALDVTVQRFPSIAMRLRRGLFWYYLEEVPHAPEIREDGPCPLLRMPFDDIRKCAFRVLYYKNRIAVEYFHALTDGTGGVIFLKSLLAEYITQKYGENVPCTHGVLSRTESPREEELEDSFIKNCGPVSADRREEDAWHLPGTPEKDGYNNLISLEMPADALKREADKYGVTVNSFLCAAMMKAILDLQAKRVPRVSRRKAVKVMVPVNLRRFFGSSSMRNFAFYVTPSVDPRMGDYTMEELCSAVHHQMGAFLTKKQLQARFTTNVVSEKIWLLRIMPLFIKNMAMKFMYNLVGERKSCLCLSNLGRVTLPEEMARHVVRIDFILGVQASLPNNCGVATYNGVTHVNFIRNIRESELEYRFFRVLQEQNIPVTAESNQR